VKGCVPDVLADAVLGDGREQPVFQADLAERHRDAATFLRLALAGGPVGLRLQPLNQNDTGGIHMPATAGEECGAVRLGHIHEIARQ
jgi:hypothetical protein